MYTDRSYEFTSIPNVLLNETAIRTANTDKFSTTSNADFITFAVNQDVNIYILYTNIRSSVEKDWLNESNGWVLEDYTY